jgi:hypothetical protein
MKVKLKGVDEATKSIMQGMNVKKSQKKKVKQPRLRGGRTDAPVAVKKTDASTDRITGGRGTGRRTSVGSKGVKGAGESSSVKSSPHHIFDDASALSDAMSDCESVGSLESKESIESGASLSVAAASMGYLGERGHEGEMDYHPGPSHPYPDLLEEGNIQPSGASISTEFSLLDLMTNKSDLVLLIERISGVLRRVDDDSVFAGYHCSVMSSETSATFKVKLLTRTYMHMYICINTCII